MLTLGMQLWKRHSAYIDPLSLWTFESDLLTDSFGTNDLTNINSVTQDSANAIIGTYAAKFITASAQYLEISDANLSVGFPGKSGGSQYTVTITGFFNLSSIATSQYICGKYLSSTNERSYSLVVPVTTEKLAWNLGSADGTSHTALIHDSTVVIDNDYFFAVSFDSSTKEMKVHVYDVTADAILGIDKTVVISENYNLNTQSFKLGSRGDTNHMQGYLDNIAIYNKILSDDEISLARQGLH